MEVSIFTRNMEPTPRLEDYVEQKVNRLDRYLPDIDEAQVDLKVENARSAADRQVAQLTIRTTHGMILRAEERTADMFMSIDSVLDKMYRQMARYKGKRQDRWQAVPEELPISEVEAAEETRGEIVRVKRFGVRPMSPEEAIEQLQLLGHEFYVFMNADDDNSINVLYQRADGDYGLLQPELA
jgi:putative sigma-54 modulation protein